MKITIILDFANIRDVNSEDATNIVDAITRDTVRLQDEWSDHSVVAWVDDVIESEG